MRRIKNDHKSASGTAREVVGRVKPTTDVSQTHGEDKLPDPASDEFAHLVATCAWRDGLTANAITKRLFDDSSPRHLMQVKRALKRAHKTAVLRLVAPENIRLYKKLDSLVNANVQGRRIGLHVVQDNVHLGGAPVYAKAAELIADLLLEAARQKQFVDEAASIVICNAGGRTVSETVKALVRNPPILEDSGEPTEQLSEALLFVAGNAAYQPEQFHRSANFLSVTMAELFESGHLALPKEEDQQLVTRHAQLIERASLFICGAGTCRSADNISLMAQYFQRKGWELPESAVGDLAFNLLDKDGAEVEVPSIEAREFMRQLNPSLNLSRLMHIASSNRVLVVLDAKDPKEKSKIGRAILRRRYATDVVLGTRLAIEIINTWNST